jgi:hypothetical protein
MVDGSTPDRASFADEVNTGEDKFVISFASDAGFLEYFLIAWRSQ